MEGHCEDGVRMCTVQMFTHISEAVASKAKNIILDMTMALTDSVSSLK